MADTSHTITLKRDDSESTLRIIEDSLIVNEETAYHIVPIHRKGKRVIVEQAWMIIFQYPYDSLADHADDITTFIQQLGRSRIIKEALSIYVDTEGLNRRKVKYWRDQLRSGSVKKIPHGVLGYILTKMTEDLFGFYILNDEYMPLMADPTTYYKNCKGSIIMVKTGKSWQILEREGERSFLHNPNFY